MKKLFLLLGILLGIGGCSQQSEEIIWHMPTPYSDSVFHTKNIRQFVKDVATFSEQKLIIKVHPGASVIKHPEIKRSVRSGQVPLGEVLMSLLGNENPLFQVDVLPLLATNYDQAKTLWKVSRQEIEAALAEQNLKLLYAVPWPPQGLYVKQKIDSLDDMQGLKVRAYNAMLSRLVELMGGIPTTVESPEIPQAFSTGVIDAMMTSPSTGVSSQSWDFVSHYYDFQAWIPKNMVIVNLSTFNLLSEELKTNVLQAARQAEKRGWQMSQQETAEKTQILAEHGIKIMQPSETLSEQLVTIREQMAKEWEAEAGEKGAKILEAYATQKDHLFHQPTFSMVTRDNLH